MGAARYVSNESARIVSTTPDVFFERNANNGPDKKPEQSN